MGLIRKIAGFLGLSRDDTDAKPTTAPVAGDRNETRATATARAASAAGDAANLGFGVKIPVIVERPNLGPLIVPCDLGNCGVQGFKWYTSRLRIDEDGDVADEFLEEAAPSTISALNEVTTHALQTNYRTLPTAMAMRKQVMVVDGNLCQSLEYQGRLRWV